MVKQKYISIILVGICILFCVGCSKIKFPNISSVRENVSENMSEKIIETETQDMSYLQDYYNLIVNYEDKYGKVKKDKESSYLLYGLCYAKLVDFNNDDVLEIVLAYGEEKNMEDYSYIEYSYEVWAYVDEQISKVGSGTPCGFDGNTNEIRISSFNGEKYLISGGGDQSVKLEFYGFNGREMYKEIEFYKEFNCDDGSTKYMIDNKEILEEDFSPAYNSRMLHVEIGKLFDGVESNKGIKASRNLIKQTKNKCKNYTSDTVASNNKQKDIEVSLYFDNWDLLIKDLSMEQQESKEIVEESISYAFGSFYLEKNNVNCYINNEANNGISLYGILPGSDVNTADKIMKDNGWTSFYIYEKVYEYVLIDGDKDYFVSIETDESGNILYWELYNYCPVSDMSNYYKQMRIDSMPEWKKRYYDYLTNISDNRDIGYTEVQFVYIDNDDIPEMIIDYGSTAEGGELCYISNNNMQIQIIGSYGVSYIEKENIFCNSGGHMDNYYNQIFRLKNGKIESIAEGAYGAEDNSNVQIDENGNLIYDYYWNGKKVSEEKYQKNFKNIFNNTKAKSPYQDMFRVWDAQEELIYM